MSTAKYSVLLILLLVIEFQILSAQTIPCEIIEASGQDKQFRYLFANTSRKVQLEGFREDSGTYEVKLTEKLRGSSKILQFNFSNGVYHILLVRSLDYINFSRLEITLAENEISGSIFSSRTRSKVKITQERADYLRWLSKGLELVLKHKEKISHEYTKLILKQMARPMNWYYSDERIIERNKQWAEIIYPNEVILSFSNNVQLHEKKSFFEKEKKYIIQNDYIDEKQSLNFTTVSIANILLDFVDIQAYCSTLKKNWSNTLETVSIENLSHYSTYNQDIVLMITMYEYFVANYLKDEERGSTAKIELNAIIDSLKSQYMRRIAKNAQQDSDIFVSNWLHLSDTDPNFKKYDFMKTMFCYMDKQTRWQTGFERETSFMMLMVLTMQIHSELQKRLTSVEMDEYRKAILTIVSRSKFINVDSRINKRK